MLPVSLTPQDVCDRLDEYVVGQPDAKRAIAIALRNRWRRMRVESEMRDEIIPKNILMIGPTGCGKTEIARRLAKLANAPFVKVEATKFTEVGFHGRDVDTIVRDLVEASATLVKELKRRQLEPVIEAAVEEQLLQALGGGDKTKADTQASLRKLLRDGTLDQRVVQVELPVAERDGTMDVALPGGQSMVFDASELLSRMNPGAKARTQTRKLKVEEARPLLLEAELQKRLQALDVKKEAVRLAEQHGIVVIDEIDKIVPDRTKMRGGDASDEGVQRDLLPLIEGTTVDVRKYGPVKTDHVLFVCSGAFHASKPSDMLAELQGRLPIRVELKGLTAEDLYRILTEPRANLLEQQKALMKAEGVTLEIDDDAIREMANRAAEINKSVENIGARRLYTVIERVMDDLSFEAADMEEGEAVRLTKALVEEKLENAMRGRDLKKFIL
ncbi:hypothetical protein FNF29_01865 [Cafeteria roenbergensis]|uniref:AAA+ ATPase domain-containing protein n=1 Tax=Cafeteria roenbergensis TaxID=33653 RepID=A0A5A8CQX2_CAFRO|nr:hypothetical protein FNF29_01865 [Cafeteria roenbergensis]|eukprot:KAA0155492.1 hypothetical protein FNF29_01865 [Cafeteria roenbergensis]